MSEKINWPNLDFQDFNITRDIIHSFAIVLGKVREQLSPIQEDYWHISLRVIPQGLTTTPIRTANGQVFEIVLNLINHKIEITNEKGNHWSEELVGLSVQNLIKLVLMAIEEMEIPLDLELNNLNKDHIGNYNFVHAENLWLAYYCVYSAFSEFRKKIEFGLSPIQIWPHHFDISFSSYTGNKIQNQKDPELEEKEQITYGFLTGDTTFPEPYFYVITYPKIKNISDNKLESDAFWYDEDWQGAIVKYQDLHNSQNFDRNLLSFLTQTKKIIDIKLLERL